jgi:nucleoside-diphosphate-sugar epimerase
MKIFVTGASGFVGRAALRKLVAAGHTVSAMSRSAKSDATISALGATPLRCDLDTVAASHLAGAEAVIHSAAYVEDWGPKEAWFLGNVIGTQNVLAAASAAGVRRFIHIGTEAAIVHGQHIRDADETYPLAPDSPYPYCATKAQAETRVRSANQPGRFETIVLRPRFIWGPDDTTLLPKMEAKVRAGQWSWIDHGRALTSTTHIDNLVHAIELALTRGRGGEAYFILDDGTTSLHDIVTGMLASRGLTPPERSVPSWLADAAGQICEGIWRLFGLSGEPPLTRHAAMVMSRDCTLTDAKARADLGYSPVISVAAGLAGMRKGQA